MTKATLRIAGDNVHEEVVKSIANFQQDEYVIHYEFDSGSVFMFEQYKRSLSNFVLNVILDFSINPLINEFEIQCFAMGAKNRAELNMINYEKSTIEDLRLHLFGYAKRNNLNWQIEELIYV